MAALDHPGRRAEINAIPDPHVKVVVERMSRHLAEEDYSTHPVTTLVKAAADLVDLGAVRAVGEAIVRVVPGEDTDQPYVMVVTDDMPFLVDSVAMALEASRCDVHLILHPQLGVERDAAGRLDRLFDHSVSSADGLPESWMWIELESTTDPHNLVGLEARLQSALHDVRVSVRDWEAMRDRAIDIAGELTAQQTPGVAAEALAEASEFLHWMADDSFVFLGYREYSLQQRGGEDILIPLANTGLGILSPQGELARDTVSLSFAALPAAVRARARDPRPLILTKANSRSTVHRSSYLDYVGVKTFDDQGNVTGERRFLGLYSDATYTESILDIPLLSKIYPQLAQGLGIAADSHDEKDLLQFLQTYPRDELLQMTLEQIEPIAASVLSLQGRRITKVYLRPDDYERFMSCLVYLPRDGYTTAVRQRIEKILMETFGGIGVDYTVLVSQSILARVHFVVHIPQDHRLPTVDIHALEAQITRAGQGWLDEFATELDARVEAPRDTDILRTYANAFPESYKETFGPSRAVHDALIIEDLEPGELSLETYEPSDGTRRELRFKVTRIGPAMSLSQALPMLQSLGVDVVDQYPFEISRALAEPAWILDFGLLIPEQDIPDRASLAERFEEAFMAMWSGSSAVDPFNALIVVAGLRWREVLVLRALARYLKQLGSTFGQEYIEQVLVGNATCSKLLAELFLVRMSPQVDRREVKMQNILSELDIGLDAVVSLDEDRILRSFQSMIMATLRTNFFQASGDAGSIAFKFDPKAIADVPQPRPRFEVWMYSPRVEGVHLRFGSVARGGLRWSDRREDFRTEILGLVKAQEVKNAVIVPVGAKGGFYPKSLPDPAVDRDAWLEEGKAAYREFIGSLLDITDNLVDGVVVPPPDCVRYDGDDPYLVVAADKGTATFSDIANAISLERGFWLGDAFASGGSAGYDHKAMGITARGAWESVKAHFRDLGIDTQAQDFTVVGIGDMSGDVFGNGMLLSEHIRLIAAFDHRHVFIDPNPDAAVSFSERRRLFELPRSSWADYDPALISPGGGVFSRSAKSVELTPQIVDALGIPVDVTSVTPDELIRYVVIAEVDLLWNGGIGTYVKAQTQTQADVGDKANDRIRVNGNDLRCRVIGEGGNLGLTQLGRIEAARKGIRLNTDAIDNSAGVDTSDHEVNIKILLQRPIERGELDVDQRNALLAGMTDDVAASVLEDNYAQNVVLANARAGAPALITVHQRMIRDLESRGILDRAIEYLPDDEELITRRLAHQGLTTPELAVLLAYAKISLAAELNESDLSDDPYFGTLVSDYFPAPLRQGYPSDIENHPLRKQIISTVACNEVINIGGVTFMYRASEETGATGAEIVRAAYAAIEIFGIRHIEARISGYDNVISASAQAALHLEMRRLLDRATRWFLHLRGGSINVGVEVARYQPLVSQYSDGIPAMLRGNETERLQRRVARFMEAGAPRDLAESIAAALDVFSLLDIADIAQQLGEPPADVVPLYFAVSDRFDIDRTLVRITDLPREDHWSSLARQAMRADLYAVVAALTERVLRATPAGQPPLDRLTAWEAQRSEGVTRARSTLDDIAAVEAPDLATLSVCLRVLRNLVAQGGSSD